MTSRFSISLISLIFAGFEMACETGTEMGHSEVP